MTSVSHWLRQATAKLTNAGVESARLDAELLLMHAWNVERAHLIAYSQDKLPAEIEQAAEHLLQRRCSHEPLAYLTGVREFWSRDFEVDPNVLIPRPETEHLIEAVLARFPDRDRPWRFADIGTGSGCLAVTLACEYPNAQISATDISASALPLARRNAMRHDADSRICWYQGDLYDALPEDIAGFDAIVSNPPYVSLDEFRNLAPELSFEPRQALTDNADGLSLLRTLVDGAQEQLISGGYLIVETGPCGLPPPTTSMALETDILDLAGRQRGGVYIRKFLR